MDSLMRLKALSPQQLLAHGFLSSSPDDLFICPICSNGNGEDGTGISFVEQAGINKGFCHKCGTNFDNIKIFAAVYGLNWRDKRDFVEIIRRASKEFFGEGAETMQQTHTTQEKQQQTTQAKGEKKRLDCSGLYALTQKNLADFLQEHGGTFRALTADVLKHAGIGYLAPQDYRKFPTDILPTPTTYRYPALIIPTSKYFYQARFLDDGAKLRYSSYKDSRKDIFLFEDLAKVKDGDFVFLTEGYLDALSIMQAGFNATAFAGQYIPEYIQEQLKTLKNKPRFIVQFDRDILSNPATANNPEKAIAILNKLGFEATKSFLPQFVKKHDGNTVPIKDANDFLQANPDDLKMCLEDIVTEAEEFFTQTPEDEFEPELEEKTSEKKNYSAPGNDERTSKQILPDCPVDVCIPYGFSMAMDGSVWKEFVTKDPEEMLPMPLVISARRSDDNFSGTQYDICWKKHNQKKWRFIKNVAAENISDSRALAKVLSSHGVQVDSKTASRLSTYCMRMINDPENATRIPEKIYYTKTGWNKDFTQFVYPTDDDGAFPIQNGNFGFETAFNSKGNAKIQVELLVASLYEGYAARSTLGGFAIAPAIRPLFGNGAQNFLIHLHGSSGSGKTAICMNGAAMYGDPGELKGSFASTAKYALERAHRFNDLPCYTDELQALPPTRRDYFDNMIYTMEGGKRYGRLTKDAEGKDVSRSYYTHISTGEQPITTLKANQGAINRVLQIDAKNICSPALASNIYTQLPENFGHIGKKLIDFLLDAKNRAELKAFYQKAYKTVRYRAAKKNGYTKSFEVFEKEGVPVEVVGLVDRHIVTQAAIFTGLHLLGCVIAKMFPQHNSLNVFLDNIIDDDINIFIDNATMSAMTSNAERWLPIVQETVLRDPARFGGENARGEFYAGERGIDNLGYIRQNGDILLNPYGFRDLIKKLGAPSDEEIIRGFHELGVFDEGNSSKHRYQKKICLNVKGNYQDKWFYVLKKNAEELVEENRRKIIEKLVA